MTVDMGREALALAELGWPVFPLCWPAADGSCGCGGGHTEHDIGKAPIVARGHKAATIDDATIKAWWKRTPHANIGIALDPAKLLVIAPDSPDWLTAFAQLGLSPTAIVKSGGGEGHWHYYYRRPANCPVHRICRTGEYDLLTNGYVVAPPSLHQSGERYRWEYGPADLSPDAPVWAVEMLRDASPRANAPVPVAFGEPPVRLYGKALAWWDGTEFAPKPDGSVDRSETLWAIGKDLARAGATPSAIAAALADRDEALGYRKYSGRKDRGTSEYQRIALEASVEIEHEALPTPGTNGHHSAPGGALPQIDAGIQDLRTICDHAWLALQIANNPPRLFQHGGVPSRLEIDKLGSPILRELTIDRLRHEVARSAEWFTYRKDASGAPVRRDAKPSIDVIRDMLALPNPPLPALTRIVEAPVFAPDGTLRVEPGYHAAALTYFSPSADLQIPPVADQPTDEDIGRARALFFDELICDFPFAEPADKAHAAALFLLPYVRDMIAGPTPNHLIEASRPGSGKGLLAEALLFPAVGHHLGVIAPAQNDEEWTKLITTQLRFGRSVILIDNVVRTLDSGTLAAALTTPVWEGRLLGRNELFTAPVRCVWVTTANNATISTELIRRSVRIRLAPDVEKPWERAVDAFRHPELHEWLAEARPRLIWAALTLVQAWISRGRPKTATRPLGSYEIWSRVMSGILSVASIPGFLSNLDDFYQIADHEGAIWRELVDAWWEQFQSQRVGVAELFPLIVDLERFELTGNTERAQKISFGKQLEQKRDNVFGNLRIVQAGTQRRATQWRILPTTDAQKVNVVNVGECSDPPVHACAHASVMFDTDSHPRNRSTEHSPTFTTFTLNDKRTPEIGDLVNLVNSAGELTDPDSWRIAGFSENAGRRYARFDRLGEDPPEFWWDAEHLEIVEGEP